MNKLYDKQYPVTSILLLVTTGFFLTMFLLRGFAYASTQTIYEFGAMHGRSIQYFPSQIWRLASAIFVLRAFCDEYDYAIFYRAAS